VETEVEETGEAPNVLLAKRPGLPVFGVAEFLLIVDGRGWGTLTKRINSKMVSLFSLLITVNCQPRAMQQLDKRASRIRFV
jgi:hypothetical protein